MSGVEFSDCMTPVTLPVTSPVTLPVTCQCSRSLFMSRYCTGESGNTFRIYYYPEEQNIKLGFKQDFYKVNLFYELRLMHDWMPSGEWAATNHKIEFKQKRSGYKRTISIKGELVRMGVIRQRMSPINGIRSPDCTASMSKIVSGLSLSSRRKSGSLEPARVFRRVLSGRNVL